MDFRERLHSERLFFDGAMGTLLQQKGLRGGELPELWSFTHAQDIIDIHAEYLAAGCDIIKTNTFGANRYKLADSGYTVAECVQNAVSNARSAIQRVGRPAFVALSVGSLGRLLAPFGELPPQQAYEAYAEVFAAGAAAGADLFLIETMTDTLEIKTAVLAARECSELPIIVTAAPDERGLLLTGGNIDCLVALLEGLRVDALGINCGTGPRAMQPIIERLAQICSLPLVINPNADLPSVVDGKTVYSVTAEAFAEQMAQIAPYATVLGGCCGTTPSHIAAMIKRCSSLAAPDIYQRDISVICSYNRTARFGERPLVIGERINPTGKSKFKQALREHNLEYIVGEALSQEQAGADILDVNVGLPEIDEPELLCSALAAVQEVCALPLQLDSSDATALERAMRIFNGKPLINSVNGSYEVMDRVFPLVKKYGGMVVCLTLDEQGIPETAAGRVEIARRIVQHAEGYGISKRELIIDPLTITVSTSQQNARVTLEALRIIRDELQLHTVLGVSNISFGLPSRENINTAFFTCALQCGLSAGIINPLSERMMAAVNSHNALFGQDPDCERYIARYADETPPQTAAAATELTLFDAVLHGRTAAAADCTAALLQGGMQPLDIINTHLVAALDRVGEGFERGVMFLPQLLCSADAAKASFEIIKTHLADSGAAPQRGERIIIATVKGDIHDIGKNILKVLLENYGFDVIDLGRDVAPELIADTAAKQQVRLVGLSALMTTTVVNMEQTIRLLRSRAPDCRVMVGGAVLTQTYADMIGADFYSKDAMGAVRYAQRILEQKEGM